ncbi:hypothetical protein FACS189490_13920 [Clostridia bacterium]|nr:hypothetical protein FACS189490_13920 [Clostridia bacterium]
MDFDFYEIDIYDEFKKNVKRLTIKKHFFSLPAQIEELKSKLTVGDFDEPPIFHRIEPYSCDVYKVRLPNPDTNQGKSNGYRVIYAVITEIKIVVFLAIYYKKEHESLTDTYISGLIDGYFLDSAEESEDWSGI